MATIAEHFRPRRAGLALAVTASLCASIWPWVARADDTAAPDPPTGIFVEQGSAWQSDNSFDVWWHTPSGQVEPISVAHYELCPATPPGPCTEHEVAGDNITSLSLDVPHAGWFWLRVWLEDSAGNVNPAAKSAQAMIRYDDGVPPEAFLSYPGTWLGMHAPMSPSYMVEIPFESEWPMSGIRGYSVTMNGDLPDADVEVVAAQDYERFQGVYELSGLLEGTNVVRFRSVSNAGVPSQAVGIAYVRVDRTPPTVLEGALPHPLQWHQRSVVIQLEGEDQVHLSGMVPAASDMPIGDGAHIAYQLDNKPPELVRGDRAAVEVSADGEHSLTYRAFDAAGNASVEKQAVFRIDGTGPVGRFRALDSADPRRLEVEVSDATSGVADGRIEYRMEGAPRFEALRTASGSGLLSARIDDEALAAGRYELRAVVTDVAGNETVIDRWADGTAAKLGMPIRGGAQLEAGGDGNGKRCPKAAGKSRARRKSKAKRRPACRQRTDVSAKTLKLRYGRRSASSGRLTTARGAPIAGAHVVVDGQARSGGAFARIGTARTDAQGKFRFAIPAGPSRTIRYRYEGTDTVLPASAALTTKVAAAARLKVDRRRLRNGQAVRFSGRLLGGPVPAAGKLVALQAKVGRGWRTFATPRANAKGIFRHRYRFLATTGLRHYEFRAVVAREAAYPYEKGVSPVVRVTVRGR